MNTREEPFLTNGIYHVYNKTADKRLVFQDSYYCSLFYNTLSYYRASNVEVSYSRLRSYTTAHRKQILLSASIKKHHWVQILAYTFMPNHFHILLKQLKDEGISRFISDSINSFTRHYNLKNNRRGPIFLPKFKSVKVRNDQYLMHVSRYIHLNQYSSGLLSLSLLATYRWSSYREYLYDPLRRLSDDSSVLKLFNNDRKRYASFVESRAETQKSLEMIKHALKWGKSEREKRRRSYLEP